MKNLLLYTTFLVMFMAAACHKSKTAQQLTPTPTPTFDSVAYKDSVQHIQDSIAYEDSVQHVQDSTIRYYFDRMRGTRLWDADYFSYSGAGVTHSSIVHDTAVSLDYANPDTSFISVKFGTYIFPQDSLSITLTNTMLTIASRTRTGWQETFTINYFFANDSMNFEYYHILGHGYNTASFNTTQ